MEVVERNHPVPPEELMAYLDGELESERAPAVPGHLAGCRSCETLAAELRRTSRDLERWTVPAPDRALQPPFAEASSSAKASEDKMAGKPSPTFAKATVGKPSSDVRAPSPDRRRMRGWFWLQSANVWALAGAMIVVCAGLWVSSVLRSGSPVVDREVSFRTGSSTTRYRATVAAAAESAREITASKRPEQDKRTVVNQFTTTPANQGQAMASQATEAGQKIIRTVSMTIVAKEFDTVRDTLDRLLRDLGGFVGGMQASDADSGRSLRATLRVPAARLDETIRLLRTLGHVLDESQSGQDVTEQVRDLEARLTNSRNTEKRLTEVLNNRTGRVSDVLEVEREIARVREEIERMDAQRLNFERQVEYSTVTVQVTEQRQATLDLGPTPVRTQLRNAFVEGLKNAYETLVSALVWVLGVGPFVVLWSALLWWPTRIVLRTARARPIQRTT